MATEINCREAIASGVCHADCCGLIPFNLQFYAQHHELVVDERVERLLRIENFTLPITDDLQCCFLDREDLKCLIYDDRPGICRLFGNIDNLRCPYYDSQGNSRTRSERRRILRAAETKLNSLIRQIRRGIRRGNV